MARNYFPPSLRSNFPPTRLPSEAGALHGYSMRSSLMIENLRMTMAEFTKALQYVLDKPVVDYTGLTGRWDLRVQWTPDESQFGGMAPASSGNPNALPGLFTAIQEQVGLKLELIKALAEVLGRASRVRAASTPFAIVNSATD
jgi:uncharacterized protein (TIGR03435 family)